MNFLRKIQNLKNIFIRLQHIKQKKIAPGLSQQKNKEDY